MHPSLTALPLDITRRRLLSTEAAAEFVGRSVPEIRRLIRAGKFPKPIVLNGRRLSFRVGDLVDFIDGKAKPDNPN